MSFLKYMRQLLTSIFSRRQSTNSPKQKSTLAVEYEWCEERLKQDGVMLQSAMVFMSGDHTYCIEPDGYPSTYLTGTMHDWHWTPYGDLARRIVGHYVLRSKTRQFEQSFFAQAMIEQKEMKGNAMRAIVKLMEDKTYNMESTFVCTLENSYGKGKNFPYSRGRFTILEIKDHERNQRKQEGCSDNVSPKEGDVGGVSEDT